MTSPLVYIQKQYNFLESALPLQDSKIVSAARLMRSRCILYIRSVHARGGIYVRVDARFARRPIMQELNHNSMYPSYILNYFKEYSMMFWDTLQFLMLAETFGLRLPKYKCAILLNLQISAALRLIVAHI